MEQLYLCVEQRRILREELERACIDFHNVRSALSERDWQAPSQNGRTAR